jgi:hypothetical protein
VILEVGEGVFLGRALCREQSVFPVRLAEGLKIVSERRLNVIGAVVGFARFFSCIATSASSFVRTCVALA